MSKRSTKGPRQHGFIQKSLAEEVRLKVTQRKAEIEVAEEVVREHHFFGETNFGDTLLDLALLKSVLSLDEADPREKHLGDVFALCDLDSSNPWHWRILLETMIEVAFKKSGAPEKWNEASLFQLQLDILELQKIEPSAKSNQEIAAALKKRAKPETKYDKHPNYLRKLIGKARNPEHNPMANYAADMDFIDFIVQQRGTRYQKYKEISSRLLEKLVEKEIEECMAWFQEKNESRGVPWTEVLREKIFPEISRMVRASLSGSEP